MAEYRSDITDEAIKAEVMERLNALGEPTWVKTRFQEQNQLCFFTREDRGKMDDNLTGVRPFLSGNARGKRWGLLVSKLRREKLAEPYFAISVTFPRQTVASEYYFVFTFSRTPQIAEWEFDCNQIANDRMAWGYLCDAYNCKIISAEEVLVRFNVEKYGDVLLTSICGLDVDEQGRVKDPETGKFDRVNAGVF